MLSKAMLCYTELYLDYAVLRSATQSDAIPHRATLSHAGLRYAMLCYAGSAELRSAAALSPSRPALCDRRRVPRDPRPALKSVCLASPSLAALCYQRCMPRDPRPASAVEDVCLASHSLSALCDHRRLPLRPLLRDQRWMRLRQVCGSRS